MKWRDLVNLLSPVRVALAIAALLQGLSAAASIIPFICVVQIARELTSSAVDESYVNRLVIVAVIAFMVRLVAHGVSGQITHLADNTFQLSIRQAIAGRMTRLPLGWFDRNHSGAVKSAVQNDVASMHYMVAHSLPDLVAGVVAPLVALGYLVTIDWRMTLVTLLPIAVFCVMYAAIVRGYSGQAAGHAAALRRVDVAVIEFMHGIGVVKAFGQSQRAHDRFVRSTNEFADHHEEWVRPIARRSTIGELACLPATILTLQLAAGIALVDNGSLDPVDVAAFALLGLGLTAPLLTLGYSAQGFKLALDAAGRVSALLQTPQIAAPSSPGASARGNGVALEGVCFSYGSGDVLRSLDASFAPGTITALVGPSGAGKSTLAALIPRFWDVREGSVRVGGTDVRELHSDELYSHVAFVFQDAGLLRSSVRDNIRIARPDALQAEVETAARAAQIHERIVSLPAGYDAVVGVDARLSGGEEQRVAIARALLADRPIVVLDEATAFADPDSEAAIQDAISELVRGRTVIVIAHRLNTIVGVDQICFVADGQISERGTHQELLDRDGAYAALWKTHSAAVGTAS